MFDDLDLTGVRPTSVPMDTVDVQVDPEVMVDGYAQAFVQEMERVNPRRFAQVPISEEEMTKYCRYLLEQRIKCVHHQSKDWQALKQLWIPVFIQYAMRLVGEVKLYDQGLTLNPVIEETSKLTIKEAIEISHKIGYYQNDLQMVLDAMPRSSDGDRDTMSCALIADYVRSLKPVEHPVATYIAAFLGFTLAKEQAFQVLYRTQYDDINFIRVALTNNQVVMGYGDKD